MNRRRMLKPEIASKIIIDDVEAYSRRKVCVFYKAVCFATDFLIENYRVKTRWTWVINEDRTTCRKYTQGYSTKGYDKLREFVYQKLCALPKSETDYRMGTVPFDTIISEPMVTSAIRWAAYMAGIDLNYGDQLR